MPSDTKSSSKSPSLPAQKAPPVKKNKAALRVMMRLRGFINTVIMLRANKPLQVRKLTDHLCGFTLLIALLLCLTATAAVDNNPRVVRLHGLSGLWLAPSAPTSFTNTGPITIVDNTVASPYPQTITVPSVSRTLAHITVILNDFSHTFPDDCDILLVNPQGTNIVLMSDCGGNATHPISHVTLTFTDTATTPLPDSTQIVTGTYQPTNYGAGDSFPPPAPSGSLTTTFNDFLGLNPSGVWSLYVMDDQGGDAGSIAGGFTLIFEYQ